MAEVTQLIHHYLRHKKKFPHVLCPGCGHGIFLGSLIRAVHGAGLSKDEVVVVSGIGCSGRLPVYVDFNTVHATHGRALTFATGIKMANPKLTVIVLMGDGDALSIGGNHLIHACRRNIGLTTVILNNAIYGMTGGQCSSTTPLDRISTTTPFGQLEKSFDIVQLTTAAGANFVARSTAFHAALTDTLLDTALRRPGFNLVEFLSPCHTQYGRKNKYKTVIAMYEELKSKTLDVKEYATLSPAKQQDRIPIGVFVRRDDPSLEQRYAEMAAALATEGS